MPTSDGSFSIGSTVWPGVSKLLEEMGELTQVLGKLIAAKGEGDHWDGTDLIERLHEELADVQAAITFIQEANGILNRPRIGRRAVLKLATFWRWQYEQ